MKKFKILLATCLGITLLSSSVLANETEVVQEDVVEEKAVDKESQPVAVEEDKNIIEEVQSKNIVVAQNHEELVVSDIDSWMPDKNLQIVIAKALRTTVDKVTKEEMTKLSRVDINNKDYPVLDIKGLEYATNLDTVSIAYNSLVSDFSPLEHLNSLTFVTLSVPTLVDANFPVLPNSVKYLYLMESKITSESLNKVGKIESLEYIQMQSVVGITSIAPLTQAKKLKGLYMQFTSVADFTPILEMPSLTNIYAYSQQIGDDSTRATVYKDRLEYDKETQTLFIPSDMFPNRLTHFNGKIPSFTSSTSASSMILKLDGEVIPGDRITSLEDGLKVSKVSEAEFDKLREIYLTSKLNNSSNTYGKPDGYNEYAVSGGIYTNTLDLVDKENDAIVKYVDEEGNEIATSKKITQVVGKLYDVTTPEFKISIPGYTLDTEKLPSNAKGVIGSEPVVITYVYKKDAVETSKVIVKYVDESNKEIADPKTLTDELGVSYDVSTSKYKIDIKGYTLDEKKLPSNAVGKFEKEDIVVVYTYKAETPATKEEKEKGTPSTGISENIGMVSMLLISSALVGACVYSFVSRKKKTNE